MSQFATLPGRGDGLGKPPAVPIATLPPIDVVRPELPINPRTGEPHHGATIAVAYGVFLAVGAVQALNLALVWLRAIQMSTFWDAARLLQWTNPRPGSAASILIAVAVIAIGVVLVAVPVITGYLGWVGRSAAIWWAIAAALLSLATLVTTPYPLALNLANVGWLGVPLSLVGALVMWLPASRARLDVWRRFANPPSAATQSKPIIYGRLEQYR